MCRRNQLMGYVMLGFGIGLLVGYSLESWLLCIGGCAVCIVLGLSSMQRK